METLIFPDYHSDLALVHMLASVLGIDAQTVSIDSAGTLTASSRDGYWYRDQSRGVICVDLAS